MTVDISLDSNGSTPSSFYLEKSTAACATLLWPPTAQNGCLHTAICHYSSSSSSVQWRYLIDSSSSHRANIKTGRTKEGPSLSLYGKVSKCRSLQLKKGRRHHRACEWIGKREEPRALLQGSIRRKKIFSVYNTSANKAALCSEEGGPESNTWTEPFFIFLLKWSRLYSCPWNSTCPPYPWWFSSTNRQSKLFWLLLDDVTDDDIVDWNRDIFFPPIGVSGGHQRSLRTIMIVLFLVFKPRPFWLRKNCWFDRWNKAAHTADSSSTVWWCTIDPK